MTLPNHAQRAECFVLPVMEKYILYAPRAGVLASVNRPAVWSIRNVPEGTEKVPDALAEILRRLDQPAAPAPAARKDPLVRPAFLGLITTRQCNLDCRYCDFPAPEESTGAMTAGVARCAVDGYIRLLETAGSKQAEIHFFGGEPFFGGTIVQFAVEYALARAGGLGMGSRFEVTTNGVFDGDLCRWIGDRFDTVVLSLDGPRDVQDSQRPATGGRSAFPIVVRNAQTLSESPAELVLRACVSRDTAARMEEIARWMAGEFRPGTVCFEPLVESEISRKFGLQPPDPWEFARNFVPAAAFLEQRGIHAVVSSAEMDSARTSFCPLGNDALIVAPDGAVEACYLPPRDWIRRGMDLRMGSVSADGLELDPARLQAVRDYAARAKPLCAGCFCRFHCAGGCHVRHDTSRTTGQYDAFCIQTRSLSLAGLLRQLGETDLAERWLQDRAEMERTVLQPRDALLGEEAIP